MGLGGEADESHPAVTSAMHEAGCLNLFLSEMLWSTVRRLDTG